jgi:hypothetical protein
VGGLGRLAGVDVLGYQDAAELRNLAKASVTLVRDGVALGLAAHLGLLLGADPQIEHDAWDVTRR